MDTAFIVIDMQNEFVRPWGKLHVAGAEASLPAIQICLAQARSAGWPVFHVIREHHQSGTDIEPSRMSYFKDGEGVCIPGSAGAAVVDELRPLDGEYIIRKRRFSGFFHTELDLVLRRLGIRNLIITGTQYPNCVRGTAVDGMSLDYRVIVATDACSAQTPEVAESNILDLKNMGITCVPVAEIEAVLHTFQQGGNHE